MCKEPVSKPKNKSFLQRITGLGRTKHSNIPAPASVYQNSRFTRTEVSLTSTIRRIPTAQFQTTATGQTPIIKLDVSVQADTRNIDAVQGGQCNVLCKVTANYTFPSPIERTTGFDGVILFDTTLSSRKLRMAMETAKTIVSTCTSHDRLGLVTFGENTATISELIMCTNPYKTALINSVVQIESTEVEETPDIGKALDMALRLLEKDARQGGHVFVLSSGYFTLAAAPLNRNATIHVAGIGPLTHLRHLNQLVQNNGTILDVSDTQEHQSLTDLITHISTHQCSPPIDTIRVRLSHPPEIQITSLQTPSLNPPSPQTSLTLGTTSFLHTNPRKPPPAQHSIHPHHPRNPTAPAHSKPNRLEIQLVLCTLPRSHHRHPKTIHPNHHNRI